MLALIVLLVFAGGATAGGYFWYQHYYGGKKYYTGPTATAAKQTLQIRITEGGELESSENSDIKVRAKTKKGVTLKILKVIPDGTYVKSERIVVELDPSPLVEQKEDQKVVLDKAKAEMTAAELQLEIVKKQNEIDKKKADVDRDVAKLEYEKYRNGDYVIESNDLMKEIEDALSDVKLWQKRYAWSLSMLDRAYYTEMQVAAERASKNSSEIKLNNLLMKKKILASYTKEKMETELRAKAELTKIASDIADAQARAKEAIAKSDYDTAASLHKQENARYIDIVNQIKLCTIRAKRDGLVIHHVPEQSRFGRGSSQAIIAENEPVTYGQKLMQIPDLTQMQVKVKVHEASVKYLRSADPDNPKTWQRVDIRIPAWPSRMFKGHVKKVATVASKSSWLSSDVRVYETVITIDDDLSSKILKPGMSAVATIVAYETPKPVLSIPIEAVVGTVSMGKHRKCFVINEDNEAEMRDIEIGMSNEREVEILAGLEVGEKVARDPEQLLPKDSPLRASRAPEQRGGKRGRGGPRGKTGKKNNEKPKEQKKDKKTEKQARASFRSLNNPQQRAAGDTQQRAAGLIPAVRVGRTNARRGSTPPLAYCRLSLRERTFFSRLSLRESTFLRRPSPRKKRQLLKQRIANLI